MLHIHVYFAFFITYNISIIQSPVVQFVLFKRSDFLYQEFIVEIIKIIKTDQCTINTIKIIKFSIQFNKFLKLVKIKLTYSWNNV